MLTSNQGERASMVDDVANGWTDADIFGRTFDVIVIGAGSAGIMAAIQAARVGADTLLIEKNGMLGGTTTVASVNFPGLFHADGHQIIAGIGWELVRDAVEAEGRTLQDFSDPKICRTRHPQHHIYVNRCIFASLAEERLIEAGGKMLLHTMLADVTRQAGLWQLRLCTIEGLKTTSCRILVDCSGDAQAVGLLGLERRMSPELQPGTIQFTLGGYDLESIDVEELDRRAEQAIQDGRLRRHELRFAGISRILGNRGDNAIHNCRLRPHTSVGKTHADIAGRQSLQRVYRFLRGQPGLENLKIEYCANETGIRETWTIVGKETVTLADYQSGRVWPDAVCNSWYPVDIHRPNGDGIDKRHLPEGVLPTIPRGAMLPAQSENLLVAGRCASGDQEANSAFRTQPSCMAMGQAAGAMGALAVQTGTEVSQLPMPRVHALLKEHGAILPGERIACAATT